MSISNVVGVLGGATVAVWSAYSVIWAQKVADNFNEINAGRPRWRAHRHRSAGEVRFFATLSLALGVYMLVLGLSGSFV
jgi:uncharacterized BrkB/YihY/UPF0761 family membrane protein